MDYQGGDRYQYYAGRRRNEYSEQENSEGMLGRGRGFGNRGFEAPEFSQETGMPRKHIKSQENGPGKYYHEVVGEPSFREGTSLAALKSHNKENLGGIRRNRPGDMAFDLSMEEGEQLLKQWEQNHFIEFNSWLQNAKAKLHVDMEERVTVNGGSGGSTYQSKTYQCHLDLSFSDKSIDPLMSNGLGKSKKEARKVGIRHLATLLIQNGLIRLGLKDRTFIKTARPNVDEKFRVMNKSTQDGRIDYSQDERNKRLKKEIKRLGRRMQDALRDDNFVEACQYFCQIICNKTPEWNEVAQIWGYAVSKKDIKLVKIILDLIQYKRINKDMTDDSESQDDQPSGRREELEGRLKSMYGFGRVRTQNPYDIVDIQGFEITSADCIKSHMFPMQGDSSRIEEMEFSIDSFTTKLRPLNQNESAMIPRYPDEANKLKATPEVDQDKSMAEYDPSICNLKIDQTTSKEFKEGSVNYLNFRLLNEMYEMLMYSGDLQFSIQSAENLFSRTRIDDEEFYNPYAAYYYAQRRNMIELDLMESFYKSYLNLQCEAYGMVRAHGTLSKIGYKFKQQVVLFTPTTMDSPNWDYHIIRRGTTVTKEIHTIRENTRLNEKEYVLLMTLEEDKVKVDSEFNDLLNAENGSGSSALSIAHSKDINLQKIKNSSAFQKCIGKGNRVGALLVAFVIDIQKDYSVKLYTLPSQEDAVVFNDPKAKWMLLRMPIHGHHQASFQALEQFTTKSCATQVISHLIFSPPLTSKLYIGNLCNTKANFEAHQSQRVKTQIKSLMLSLTDKLDESQQKAVEFSLTHSISLIHAPTCSGKLATMGQIVASWLNISNSAILICAESNVKADLLHLSMLNSNMKSIRVITSPDEEEYTRLIQLWRPGSQDARPDYSLQRLLREVPNPQKDHSRRNSDLYHIGCAG